MINEMTERNSAEHGASSSVARRNADAWSQWPDAEFEIDDEAFAAAIAVGREVDQAA